MKGYYILVICLLLSLAAQAQDHVRTWNKGPLTWNDFKVVRPSVGDEHSYLEFTLDISTTPEERYGATLWAENAVASIDRDRSWVDSAYRTPEELQYNQVLFNIVECYRRQMQIEIDTGGTPDANYYMKLLVYTADSFCLSTAYGADTAAVHYWDYVIHERLAALAPALVENHGQRIAPANYMPTRRFGFGMGGGLKATAGDLHHYFRSGGAFAMDFEIGEGHSLLNFGMLIGGSRCLDSVFHKTDYNNDLWTNDRLSVLDFNMTYGYAVVDNPRFRVMPFGGIGMLGYFLDQGEDESSVGPVAFSYLLGVDLRYNFSNDMYIFHRHSEQMIFALYGKAYLSYNQFNHVEGNLSGLTFNLAVGLAFHECGGKRIVSK